MRFKFFCLSLFILFPIFLGSQESGSIIQAPFVSYLNAELNGSRVVLNWRDPADTENLIYEIHRYGEEITTDNLEQSELLAHVAPGIRSFTDSPPGEGPWWYAVISRKNGKTLKLLIPWRNSLGTAVALYTENSDKRPVTEAVAVAAEPDAQLDSAPVRPIPLPLLAMDSMPAKKALSEQAAAALKSILGPTEGELWEQAEAEILSVDYGSDDGASGSILKDILEGPFSRQEWSEAELELIQLSASLNLDKQMKARILFYKGECQYFQYRLQDAFLSFLVSSDCYYAESRRWMLRIYKDSTPVS